MLMDGKKLLITGVLMDSSIAFHVARLAQQEGATVVLTSFGRTMRITQAIAKRLPFQVVMAGKAHLKDAAGKEGIHQVGRHARVLGDALPVIFVPGYDMALAGHLVAGCDVWLNKPVPSLEASGTSGMKAALNGVLNLSILDGWWI